MKKTITIFSFLLFAFITSAQTLTSNQFPKFSTNIERIDFTDSNKNTIVSLPPKFYKHHNLKERIKPIKIKDENFFIKIEKFGAQAVYSSTGELVVEMNRNGNTIHFAKEGLTFFLRSKINWTKANSLECYNSEGLLVSEITWNNNRRLVYDYKGDEDVNHLLAALCVHQYQQCLFGQNDVTVQTTLNNLD